MFEDNVDPEHFYHHRTKAECIGCRSQPDSKDTCQASFDWIVQWHNIEVYINIKKYCSNDDQVVKLWTCNTYNSVFREKLC